VPGSPLHAQPDWASAFKDAGRQVAALAGRGTLARGQRAVLAQHLIFLFNRHGVSAADQYALASAACQVIFEDPAGTPRNGSRPGSAARLSAVTMTADNTGDRAAALRNELADFARLTARRAGLVAGTGPPQREELGAGIPAGRRRARLRPPAHPAPAHAWRQAA
jgi:hypothetical protein